MSKSKTFWRIGVECPPTRGIQLFDFDGAVSALNSIAKWLKEGRIIRSVSLFTKENADER